MSALALDLGSRRIGCVAASLALPLVFAAPPSTLLVEGAASTVATVVASSPELVVLEYNLVPYMPPGLSPQAYQGIAAAHELCAVLHHEITRACDAGGIPCVTIARNSWAHRVKPHHSGGITDAQANEALRAHIANWSELLDQDQRDAAGALVGWLLGPPAKSASPSRQTGKIRDRRRDKSTPHPSTWTEEQRAEHEREASARRAQAAEQRTAAARAVYLADRPARFALCTCGPGGTPLVRKGRHPATCPGAAPHRPSGPRTKSFEAPVNYVPLTRASSQVAADESRAPSSPHDPEELATR